MMWALELQWLVKGTSLDEATLNSEEIIALVVIELHLSEGISQIVSHSVQYEI